MTGAVLICLSSTPADIPELYDGDMLLSICSHDSQRFHRVGPTPPHTDIGTNEDIASAFRADGYHALKQCFVGPLRPYPERDSLHEYMRSPHGAIARRWEINPAHEARSVPFGVPSFVTISITFEDIEFHSTFEFVFVCALKFEGGNIYSSLCDRIWNLASADRRVHGFGHVVTAGIASQDRFLAPKKETLRATQRVLRCIRIHLFGDCASGTDGLNAALCSHAKSPLTFSFLLLVFFLLVDNYKCGVTAAALSSASTTNLHLRLEGDSVLPGMPPIMPNDVELAPQLCTRCRIFRFSVFLCRLWKKAVFGSMIRRYSILAVNVVGLNQMLAYACMLRSTRPNTITRDKV
ncbi:hypothetical protein CONPUDRAFT_69625 [Coniophora puteana RWD-64-598 SS2]|uniref:Uncharacterized protein n=1 Tax=Coniophora puteana (strain RWD-64-598) TaxID=741705 RepID=A0A5M3N8C5_CONPW|nr:uncharacterized protein CONPUDRAFT_69625 [Coniophora puteana RWD-64-598 SS2]EIW87407.1 hypothetical protein CONPUDRAFT_69625 [Coniophora puteana RWD-64-598 SS2]